MAVESRPSQPHLRQGGTSPERYPSRVDLLKQDPTKRQLYTVGTRIALGGAAIGVPGLALAGAGALMLGRTGAGTAIAKAGMAAAGVGALVAAAGLGFALIGPALVEDHRQYEQGLEASKRAMTFEQAARRQIMDTYDHDGNGEVDLSGGPMPLDERVRGRSDGPVNDANGIAFHHLPLLQRIDTSSDGKVDLEEAAAHVASFDSDGNGALSFRQFTDKGEYADFKKAFEREEHKFDNYHDLR